MTRRPNEPMTPFEETLLNLPQEPAPADLQDRCLAALDAVAAARPARPPVPRSYLVMAAAASVLLALVAVPILMSMLTPAKSPGAFSNHLYAPADGPVASAPALEMAPEGPGGPAAPPAAPGGPAAALPQRVERAPASPPPLGVRHRDKLATRTDSAFEGKRAQQIAEAGRRLQAPPPPEQDALVGDATSVVPAPAEPWYDRSPERKKIATRDMTLETPEVEDTYRQAVSAIEKVGGYVAHEDVVLEEDEPDHASIQARVPAAAFDAVVQQLRGMGKLVKLTGSSEDRTQEYRSRGADIRAASDAEQQLVRRYARATGEQKRVVKAALDELRRSRQKEKRTLQQLAAETSFAYLNLEIVEGSHLWHTVRDKAADALPIAMVIALVAMPFFIVAMLWRRRG